MKLKYIEKKKRRKYALLVKENTEILRETKEGRSSEF